jgi:hypothetical protein
MVFNRFLIFSAKLKNVLKTENKLVLTGIYDDIFTPFLDFIYFGTFLYHEGNLTENYSIADSLGLEEIKTKCIQGINDSFENIVRFYKKRHTYKCSIKDMDYACEEYIIAHLDVITKEEGFQYVPKDVLERLLDSSQLLLDEIDVFHALVAWGKSHKGDVGSLAKKIRWGLLTRKELEQIVKPSKLCPEDVYELVYKKLDESDEDKNHNVLWKPRRAVAEDDFMTIFGGYTC